MIALSASGLLACSGKSPEADPTGASDAPAQQTATTEAVEKAIDEATAKAGGAHLFDPADKTFSKRACELLTADMVARLFEVPAADLKQMKMLGCLYTWEKDDQILEAKLTMLKVHKKLEGATGWFASATASKTKEQLDAEMDMVKQQVQKREELDTKLKKKTAVDMAEIAKMGSPDEGISYDDLPGVGDEARISNADGVIWVRVGNLTFNVSAYKGPSQPKPELDPKNLKGMIKAAMEAQKAWVKSTLDQRKSDSKKLAVPVVKAIAAAGSL